MKKIKEMGSPKPSFVSCLSCSRNWAKENGTILETFQLEGISEKISLLAIITDNSVLRVGRPGGRLDEGEGKSDDWFSLFCEAT